MSGAISFSGSGDPGLGQVISGASQIKTNLDTLTEQASNGLISSVFSGLGSGASIALSLSPEIAALQISQSNIAAASGPMQVTQTAMTQIQSIASNFLAEMPNLNGLDPSEIDSAAASARSVITQLASLLDTQYGNTYVFAGQDSSNPPMAQARPRRRPWRSLARMRQGPRHFPLICHNLQLPSRFRLSHWAAAKYYQ